MQQASEICVFEYLPFFLFVDFFYRTHESVLFKLYSRDWLFLATQLAGAVEYPDCISSEG